MPDSDNLKEICVYIDSSILIGMNYQFNHPVFTALKEKILEKHIRVLLTDITIREVQAHIKKDIESSLNRIKKINPQVKMLRNIPNIFSAIFSDHDAYRLYDSIDSALQEFVTDIRAEIVPVNVAIIENIFDLYFNQQPPFGAGKKKYEFPDAFILSALNEWVPSNISDSSKCYVISHDKDMQLPNNAFPYLDRANSLEHFIDLVTVHFEKLAPIAKQVIEKIHNDINALFKEKFEQQGFILIDQEGDVEDVNVILVEDLDAYLLSLTHDDKASIVEAQFEVTAIIHYTANLTYDNYETAIYDSEDKQLIPWETANHEVSRTELSVGVITIEFKTNDTSYLKISEFKFTDNHDIEVYSQEDDE